MDGRLSPDLLAKMDAWWRAANHLSAGQIYPKDNSLRGRSLRLSDIKLRLLGQLGTTPGLNFLSVHLNRLIKGNWRRIRRHRLYISEHGPDLPEILNRRWCANV